MQLISLKLVPNISYNFFKRTSKRLFCLNWTHFSQMAANDKKPNVESGTDIDAISNSILKSSSDKLNYKYIQLSNGLKALLVSDPSYRNFAANDTVIDSESDVSNDEDMTDGTSSNENDSASDLEECTARTNKSRSKTDEKYSAVAVSVNSGSFNDPKELPGLAHLVEHMISMGSEKYPSENALDEYLSRYGGYQNAHTEYEYTMYEIEVQRAHFYGALKRLANCFISPLLKPESITREIKPVDTEFRESMTDDDCRLEQLICNQANDGHPLQAFPWGNALTLDTNPKKLDIDVHKYVKQFFGTHYVSDNISVVVQSQESLSTLEDWVRQLFSQIKPSVKKNKDDLVVPKIGAPFLNNPKFNRIYSVEPINQIEQLVITWCLPPTMSLYRTSPLDYLGTIVGHEGKGGLISHLRKEGLALELSAGSDDSGFQTNAFSSMFVVSIKLTDSGRKYVDEVVECVYDYLNMLRAVGPQEWFFNELKAIEENKFNWQEEKSAVNYVKELAHNLIFYPIEHVLCGHQLYFDYDKSIIERFLSLLTPNNANYIYLFSSIVSENDVDVQKEKWMGTLYRVSDIPKSWLSLADREHSKFFHYPSVNPYIANDFSLKVLNNVPKYPTKILDKTRLKVWYKMDDKFKHPNAIIKIHVISQFFNDSLESAAALDLMVEILSQLLSEDIYDATLSGYYWSLSETATGLLITVSGFNQKLDVLTHTIVSKMYEFECHSKVFKDVKKSLSQSYHNTFIDANELNKSLRLSILCEQFYSSIEKRNILHTIDKEFLIDSVENFFSDFYLECLIQGNYTQQECIKLMEEIEQTMELNTLEGSHSQPKLRTAEIPNGNGCCRVATLGVNSNSSITSYYQIGCANIEMQCFASLLSSIMEEPCFNILRTKEGLGYLVHCTDYDTFGITGFGILVNSSADEFDCSYIDERIEMFLIKMKEILLNMNATTFTDHITAIIKLKKSPDLQLLEEVNRNWEEIGTFNYCFDRNQKEINHFEKITFSEFYHWVKNHIFEQNGRKKLTIQVVGNGKKAINECTRFDGSQYERTVDESESEDNIESNKKYDLTYLKTNTDKFHYNFIDNIIKYKKKLNIYPYHNVVE